MRLARSISSRRGQQPVAADLVEEELQRVGRDGREGGVVDRRLGRVLARAVVAQLDVAGMQLLVEGAEILVLELQGLGELVDLLQVDAAAFLPSVDEGREGPGVRVTLLCHGCPSDSPLKAPNKPARKQSDRESGTSAPRLECDHAG